MDRIGLSYYLCLQLLCITLLLDLGDRPMPFFGSPLLKLEKLFRTLLEGEPLLALPSGMLFQSFGLNSTPSLPVCVCSVGSL